MIGICFELRQPHIINEYIEGESLKDLLIKEGETISMVRRVKMVYKIITVIFSVTTLDKKVI